MAEPPQPLKVQNRGRIQEGDIVILVTGVLHAGKSTFVNALLGKEGMAVSSQMTGCTTEIDYAVIDLPDSDPNLKGRRLVIVDTPGFDNDSPSLNDTVILRNIADWLQRHFPRKITLGGIIYLHDISLARYTSISTYDLLVLRASFCNSGTTFEKVVLATTKWDRITMIQEGVDRETELRGFWKYMVDHGSEVHRFQAGNDATKRAWYIVNALLSHTSDETGVDIADRVKELRSRLHSNSSEKATKDLLASLLKLFVELIGRSNKRAGKKTQPWAR